MSALLMIRDLMELKVLPGVAVSAGEALISCRSASPEVAPPASSVLMAYFNCSAN